MTLTRIFVFSTLLVNPQRLYANGTRVNEKPNPELLNEKSHHNDATPISVAKNNNFTRAVKLIEEHNQKLTDLTKRANEGDSDSQYALASKYHHGKGVDKDFKEARKWYQKAADQGNADAQIYLGNMYYGGQDVNQDFTQAREWFELAATQGRANAQNNLGWMYYIGQGVNQNVIKACEWFEKAAEQDDAAAQSNLGVIYYGGQGVNQDLIKAREWFEKAAGQGNTYAQYHTGFMYHHGEGVDQNFKKAREWYELAADQGNAASQYNLGLIYANGLGVPKDLTKAREYFELAAAQGHVEAQYNLGLIYANGLGVPKNLTKAHEYFELAAAQDHVLAQNILGEMYYYGDGIPKNLTKAHKYFELAAKQGHVQAQHNLGLMYYYGDGISQDLTKAHKYFKLAAAQGHEKASDYLTKIKNEHPNLNSSDNSDNTVIILSLFFFILASTLFYIKKIHNQNVVKRRKIKIPNTVNHNPNPKPKPKLKPKPSNMTDPRTKNDKIISNKVNPSLTRINPQKEILKKVLSKVQHDAIRSLIKHFSNKGDLTSDCKENKAVIIYLNLIGKTIEEFKQSIRDEHQGKTLNFLAYNKGDKFNTLKNKDTKIIESYDDKTCEEKIHEIKEFLRKNPDNLTWFLKNGLNSVLEELGLSSDTPPLPPASGSNHKSPSPPASGSNHRSSSPPASGSSHRPPSPPTSGSNYLPEIDGFSDSSYTSVLNLCKNLKKWIEEQTLNYDMESDIESDMELDEETKKMLKTKHQEDYAYLKKQNDETIMARIVTVFYEFLEETSLSIKDDQTLKNIKHEICKCKSSSYALEKLYIHLNTLSSENSTKSSFESVSVSDAAYPVELNHLTSGQYQVVSKDILELNNFEEIPFVVIPNDIYNDLNDSFGSKEKSSFPIKCHRREGDFPHWSSSGDGYGQTGNSHRIFMTEVIAEGKKYWLVTDYKRTHLKQKSDYDSVAKKQKTAVEKFNNFLNPRNHSLAASEL